MGPLKPEKRKTAPGPLALPGAKAGALGQKSIDDFLSHLGLQGKPLLPPKEAPGKTPPKSPTQKAEFRKELTKYLGKVPVDKEDEVKGIPPKALNPFKNPDRFTPDEVLDLHQMTVDQALAAVKWGFTGMRYRKLTTALVITGKGLHSPQGPVVKDSVLHLLSHHTEVRRFQEAPLRLGGSGALLVELKPENG